MKLTPQSSIRHYQHDDTSTDHKQDTIIDTPTTISKRRLNEENICYKPMSRTSENRTIGKILLKTTPPPQLRDYLTRLRHASFRRNIAFQTPLLVFSSLDGLLILLTSRPNHNTTKLIDTVIFKACRHPSQTSPRATHIFRCINPDIVS